MAAEIIRFPRKTTPLRSVRSVDLYYCWDCRLNNPLLNRIFKSETCYVERWYLQSQHLLNQEEFDHPIIQTLLSKNDQTLDLLMESTEKDLTVQRYFSSIEYKDAVETNIGRLNRWNSKWKSLHLHRQRL